MFLRVLLTKQHRIQYHSCVQMVVEQSNSSLIRWDRIVCGFARSGSYLARKSFLGGTGTVRRQLRVTLQIQKHNLLQWKRGQTKNLQSERVMYQSQIPRKKSLVNELTIKKLRYTNQRCRLEGNVLSCDSSLSLLLLCQCWLMTKMMTQTNISISSGQSPEKPQKRQQTKLLKEAL